MPVDFLTKMDDSYTQAKRGLILVVIVVFLGTLGFYLIGGGHWTLEQCFYMTVITVSTVGYGEVVPLDDVPYARLFAVLLILFGMGSMVFFGSSVVALLVEKDISKLWRKRKMEKEIAQMENHVIVCGAGTVGREVIIELVKTRTPFVAIESDEQRIEALKLELKADYNFNNPLFVVGDASDDDELKHAGVEKARGIIVTLPSDKDSLIATVTARQLNLGLRIVSRCHEPQTIQRILKAGADSVVAPNIIGGMRLVSEMIRPHVVQFLDMMLKEKDKNLRVEEAVIPEGSDLIGIKLQDSWIRKITGLLVIAVNDTRKGTYEYNPGPGHVIQEGTTLILLGTANDVIKLREKLKSS